MNIGLHKFNSITEKHGFYLAWALVTIIICIYMWQWLAMPLFPDEVATEMNNGRIFFDDGVNYGLYAECPSNAKVVPIFFYPAATVLAGISSFPHWTLVRVIPLLALASLVGAVFLFDSKFCKSNYIALFFTAGFLGVSGSGLILLRPEAYLILHGAVCLYAYTYCTYNSISRNRAIGWLILLYIASLISFYVHLQGLILAPLTLMLLLRISKSFNRLAAKLIAALSTLYIFLAAFYGLQMNNFQCSESPKTAQFISAMTLPGWLQLSKANEMSNYLKKEYFERYTYFERFQFTSKYQIDYLPPTNTGELDHMVFFQYVNDAITAISWFVLVAFLILCFYMLARVIMHLLTLRRQSDSRLSKFKSFIFSNEIIFFMTCWAHLCLMIYVTQMNFYRVFYFNLAMVVLLIIALSHTQNKVLKKTAITIGIVSFLLCSVSASIANTFISSELEAGYSGPSIPLATNWGKVDDNVRLLKTACGISDDVSGIIVDDKTYDALKQHRHLVPVTYLGLSSHITGKTLTNLIKDIHAKSAVTRCDYFSTFQIPLEDRIEDLCCTTF